MTDVVGARVAPAPGWVLVVRGEERLVTRTEHSPDCEWDIAVGFSEPVRYTSMPATEVG